MKRAKLLNSLQPTALRLLCELELLALCAHTQRSGERLSRLGEACQSIGHQERKNLSLSFTHHSARVYLREACETFK